MEKIHVLGSVDGDSMHSIEVQFLDWIKSHPNARIIGKMFDPVQSELRTPEGLRIGIIIYEELCLLQV